MTDVTITGVPAFIPRSTYLNMIQQLGIDPAQVLELKWGWNTITAVVYALDENGNRYADLQTMEAATHQVCIRIDEDTCPCSNPEGWDACPVHRDGDTTSKD